MELCKMSLCRILCLIALYAQCQSLNFDDSLGTVVAPQVVIVSMVSVLQFSRSIPLHASNC